MLLLQRDATVTFCHSRTTGLRDEVARADPVVAAVGRPELITGDWIRPGAVVVDAGYTEGNVSDVEYGPASERAGFITPRARRRRADDHMSQVGSQVRRQG